MNRTNVVKVFMVCCWHAVLDCSPQRQHQRN